MMSHKFLHREEAPFGAVVWEAIDQAVVEAARSQLSARRILHIEGPYGLGLKVVPGPEKERDEGVTEQGVALSSSAAVPVVMIRKSFELAARDIAAFEASGVALDTGPASEAAVSVARQEDTLLFNGSKAAGAAGLLNAQGVQTFKLAPWDEVGTAAEDIIKAVTKLDEAGFHGPYSLALAPPLYNVLFRRYPQGYAAELDHVRTIISEAVIKAPGIQSGGVLLASGRQYASIVVGQDMMTGFVGPSGASYELAVSESIALRLQRPEAVCILRQA